VIVGLGVFFFFFPLQIGTNNIADDLLRRLWQRKRGTQQTGRERRGYDV
jgi:hypothetical protein